MTTNKFSFQTFVVKILHSVLKGRYVSHKFREFLYFGTISITIITFSCILKINDKKKTVKNYKIPQQYYQINSSKCKIEKDNF